MWMAESIWFDRVFLKSLVIFPFLLFIRETDASDRSDYGDCIHTGSVFTHDYRH